MLTSPVDFIREKIIVLKRLAKEHEEYLPEEDRALRYKLAVDTAVNDLRGEEVDEAQSTTFNSNLGAEIDVSRELTFHSRKLFEALETDSVKFENIDLKQDEIKLLKILELILEGESVSKLIDNFRKDNEDELPPDIDSQVVKVNQQFVANIDLIFTDVSDKQHVLDCMKKMDNEMAFFGLYGFYESQVLKFLKGIHLVI